MAETITVLHYQGIGDNILALPLVRALRGAFPAAWLQVMVPGARFSLYDGTGVDRLFSLADRDGCLDAPDGVVFDLDTGTQDPAYLGLVCGLRCRLLLGFRTPLLAAPREGRAVRLEMTDRPMWRQFLDLGEALVGSPLPAAEPPVLACSATATAAAERLLENRGAEPLVVVAPGAGVAEKRWPAESFAAVVRWLRHRHGATVALVGSGEERSASAALLEPPCEGILDLFASPLELAAAVTARARLTVANDSSMLHLAAALGIPAIGLYGRYCSPLTHQPMGSRFTVLYAKRATPAAIPVDEVLPHLDRYLAGDEIGVHWRQSRRIVLVETAR